MGANNGQIQRTEKKQHAILREGCFSAQVINSLLHIEKSGYERKIKMEEKT